MRLRRTIAKWWPAIVLPAAVVGVFGEALFTNGVFFERDLSLMWYPRIASVLRSVGQGAWPLWDPYPAFGTSAIADPSYQLYYPVTWLNLILGPAVFLKIFIIGHCAWAGVGMALLARRLGLGKLAAVTAGAGWMAGGPLLSLATQYHHLASASWMPWVLWSLVGLWARPTWRAAVLLAACGAAELLGGSADM